MVVHQTAERGLGFGLEEEPKLRVLKPILRDALALYVHRAHTPQNQCTSSAWIRKQANGEDVAVTAHLHVP